MLTITRILTIKSIKKKNKKNNTHTHTHTRVHGEKKFIHARKRTHIIYLVSVLMRTIAYDRGKAEVRNETKDKEKIKKIKK